MKIGIAANNDQMSEHFGHSDGLYVYTLADDHRSYQLDIIRVKPHQEGSFPNRVIAENVDVLICGGLGLKAKEKFDHRDIKVIAGIKGDIASVFNLFLEDRLVSTEEFCLGNHH